MSAVLHITLDGVEVFTGPVEKKRQVWDAMKDHPPTSARSGIVSIDEHGFTELVAISRHGATGPQWGLTPAGRA